MVSYKRKYAKVYNGEEEETSGGLKKSQITKNNRGDLVSKKKRQNALKRFKKKDSAVKHWNNAFKSAREELGYTEFVPVKKGSKFYEVTKKHYDTATTKKHSSKGKIKKEDKTKTKKGGSATSKGKIKKRR